MEDYKPDSIYKSFAILCRKYTASPGEVPLQKQSADHLNTANPKEDGWEGRVF